LLTGLPVPSELAMTGEVTLRGKVLPVGGIKEKVIAAKSAGIKRVILPSKNEKDLEDVSEPVRNALTFEFVDEIEEVLDRAFGPALRQRSAGAPDGGTGEATGDKPLREVPLTVVVGREPEEGDPKGTPTA
jgi:ATP-dependent Lon protease